MNQEQTQPGALRRHWDRGRALAAVISCVSIYGITISLFTPLLSLILDSRAVSSTLIGGLAMMMPLGVFWGLGGMAGPLVGGVAMDLWNPHGLPAVMLGMAVVFVVVSFWPRWHHPAR